MNKKNMTKMFLLVTLLILLIGVVSAAEVSNDSTSTIDTTSNTELADTTTNSVDTIEKSVTTKNTENNLKASTKTYDVTDFKTFHNALINDTYDMVTININSNITLKNTTDVNEAIKTLTINGNNKTINGNSTYQFLKINSSTVIINNIKISNVNLDYDGGIIVNGGTLTITNSIFGNNSNEFSGGVISNQKDANLTIINSTFYNNSARFGSAVFNDYGNVIIVNTTIIETNTPISNSGNMTIKNSIISNHYSQYDSAISNYGTLTIENSTLNNNIGGVIYNQNSNLTIINSTLNNNNDTVIYSNYANTTIINSTLNNNTCVLYGGTVYNNGGNLNITGSVLNNNNAGCDMYYSLGMDKPEPREGYGGAIYSFYGTSYIVNTTFNNNNATYGGAIYNYNVTSTIINSTLNNNNASEYGGAIYNNNSNMNITDCVLKSNIAASNEHSAETGSGGAIYNNGTLIITNTTLNNNTADYKGDGCGGAIYNRANLTIINATLNNNIGVAGGAILNNGTSTIKNTEINNNLVVGGSGGAIFNYEYKNMTLINITANNNSAYVGGAIRNAGNLAITNSTINNNTLQATYGGAIFNDRNLTITNTNLNNNEAIYGGAVDNDGNLTITNSTLNNNNGLELGGAIANEFGNLTIKNSILQNNTSPYSGAIYNYANNTIIENNIFIANKANMTGKAIINKGKATISNNTNAETSKYNATIYTNGINVTIKNNIFDKGINVLINSMNVLNNKYVLTTKITDQNYTKINSGRVSYTLDSKWIGSINVKNGSSWISFNVPTTGNHTIIANYIDTNGIELSIDTFTFEKKSNINVLFNAYNIKNDKVIIVSTVKDDKGNNITTGRLSYTINNKWIGSVSVKNGSSWISFNNTNNTITFKATYITDNNITQTSYAKILNLNQLNNLINKPEDQTQKNSSIHIMINSINIVNNTYILTTKVTDKNYTKLNVGRVSYTLDGKWIGSINVKNGSSWISFNVPKQGEHKIIATYIDTNGKTITNDTYTLEKKTNTNLLFNRYDVKNGIIPIVSVIKNDKGNTINNGRVSYTINGKWIGSTNVKTGSSWINFNNTNNTITFKATYISKDNITQASYTRTLDLNEIEKLKKA